MKINTKITIAGTLLVVSLFALSFLRDSRDDSNLAAGYVHSGDALTTLSKFMDSIGEYIRVISPLLFFISLVWLAFNASPHKKEKREFALVLTVLAFCFWQPSIWSVILVILVITGCEVKNQILKKENGV